MFSGHEIWQIALLTCEALRRGAMLKVAARADQLQEHSDWEGAVMWHRIVTAIERCRGRRRLIGKID
jgi:hypothetical protein